MKVIKAGFLVSYDYEFLKISIPNIYPYLSEIFLCLDIDNKTWAGLDFEIETSFFQWLEKIDIDKKITIYRDNFFQENLSVIDCDTRERQMLADRMGRCDWYLQIDSDEYFLDFEAFLKKLENFECNEPVTVNCRVIPMFKKTDAGFLVVSDAEEYLAFATNHPAYTYARHSSKSKQLYWEDLVLHQSWARESDDIRKKLDSWGHKDDFNTLSYFKLWENIDEGNYQFIKNFHPLTGETWPSLRYYATDSITALLQIVRDEPAVERQKIESVQPVKGYWSQLWRKVRKR